MELIKGALMVVLLLTNVFCQGMNIDNWREGHEENKWPNSEVIPGMLVRMSRQPGGPQHFLRLKEKKHSAKPQTARKRYTFQTFVGLMGKRSFEDQGAP